MDVRYLGQWPTPWWVGGKDLGPKMRAGFVTDTVINRHDFGISWNGDLENGRGGRRQRRPDQSRCGSDSRRLTQSSTTALPGRADPLVVFGSIDVRRKLDVHFYAPDPFWIRLDELPYRFVPMKPTELFERRTGEDKGMA